MAHFSETQTVDDILSMALEHSESYPCVNPVTTHHIPHNLSTDLSGITDQLLTGMPSVNRSNDFPVLNSGVNSNDWTDLFGTEYLTDLSHSLDNISPTLPMQLPRSAHLSYPSLEPLDTVATTTNIDDIDIEDVLSQFQEDIGTQYNQSPIPTQHSQSLMPNQSMIPCPRESQSYTRINNVPRSSPVVKASKGEPTTGADNEELEYEEDQYCSANTYDTYKPLKLKYGHPHPDPVVESMSLSSVEPPDVWYTLKYPPEVIDEVKLSSLQLEAVVYACQKHTDSLADGSRAGFLIGDGAGVGKGRTIAGIIYHNYLEGRKKALWLSVSNDLKFDAMRDLQDVGAKKVKVFALNKFQYGKISGKRNGKVKKGVIFATYSSLIGESTSGGKYRTRLTQLLHWLGPHFDGVIVFDECHKAKNLVPSGAGKPSKTGLTVLNLQNKLPKARIVYCSATGASEPKNMAYMSRLGIWGKGTQFPSFQDFIKSVERRGVGAMEIVAMDIKLQGLYIARQLSFAGVNFSIEEITLGPDFIKMYDLSTEFWLEARKLFKEAADVLDLDGKAAKAMWAQFWSAHQRFFKYLCIAAKIPSTIKIATEALKNGKLHNQPIDRGFGFGQQVRYILSVSHIANEKMIQPEISYGKCVVIGLQSTGEARTLEQLGQSDGELDGFVSTAKGVLETLIKRHFPKVQVPGMNWGSQAKSNPKPRKRKRGLNISMEEEDESSSDDSSSGNSDSAVESSDDDDDDEQEEEANSSDGSSEDDSMHPFSLLAGTDIKPKEKKKKCSPPKKKKRTGKNYSIKAPTADASEGVKFNYKTLQFERVTQSPVTKQPNVPPDTSDSLKFNYKTLQFERISPSPMAKPPLHAPGSASMQDRYSTLERPSHSTIDPMSSSPMALESAQVVNKMKEKLMKRLTELGPMLPTNSLDELIDGLGGPSKVSEMTGRRGRIVTMADGTIQYQLRTEADVSLELLNITEKQRFMDGEKDIAIISEAASSGISLQSDRRAKNQKRRLHITLELPWSADKAIQQFGRTHRSNQINAPEYIFIISGLAGEQRFASTVAKRLENLGALTHGDRRATESRDLSRYNIDTKYGRQALEISLKSFVGGRPVVKGEQYDQKFMDEARVVLTNVELLTRGGVEKESLNMTRFLNRILGLPVQLQNLVFTYFTDTIASLVQKAKREGKWDSGILDFGASGEHVEILYTQEFVTGVATTKLNTIQVERGMPFTEAFTKLNIDLSPDEGFYISNKPRNDKHLAVMLKLSKGESKYCLIHRPNTGLSPRNETLKSFLKKYTKSSPEDAEHWWNLQYEATLSSCSHSYWQGKCKLSTAEHKCEFGMRRRKHYVLTGSLLGVWNILDNVFIRHPTHAHKMQVVRVRCYGKKLVGILIPPQCVADLKQVLASVTASSSNR